MIFKAFEWMMATPKRFFIIYFTTTFVLSLPFIIWRVSVGS